MTETKTFWMVYAPGYGNPTKQHDTYEAAAEQAEQIACKNNSSTFILEAIECCKPTKPPVEWCITTGAPTRSYRSNKT
jgi:hypothetical protein